MPTGEIASLITQSPEVDGWARFTIIITKNGSSESKSTDVPYESLTEEQKQVVDNFLNLAVSLTDS